ncbi:MAG: rhodanese-like domain-containing protein [Gammaproteobacteria bacterium]|jgi:rhodanese-related sulfurtransferase
MIAEISVSDLQEKLRHGEDIFLLDVREPHEYAAFNIKGHLIPLNELLQRLNEIPKNKPIVVICRSGKRSDIAGQMLNAHGFNDVKNLAGGLLAWQEANA